MRAIDWCQQWCQARREHPILGARAMKTDFWDGYWSQKNRRRTQDEERIQWVLDKLPLSPETTVLDIGCGDGSLTIPIAQRVKLVTAIDPSRVALDRLNATAHQCGLTNVQTINVPWEQIRPGNDLPVHDIAVASFVMATLDLAQSLPRLFSASKLVYIFEAVGPRYWHYPELWHRLLKRSFVAAPDYIYLVNALQQLGVYASVIHGSYHAREYYTTPNEAMTKIMESLNVTGVEAESVVSDYLTSRLEFDCHGYYLQHHQRIAAIFWSNDLDRDLK